MAVRKPTLEEWFMSYQLAKISQRYHHVPVFAEIDVTAIASAYEARHERPPWTAIVAKAMGTAAMQVPAANCMLLRTPFGDRIVDFDHVSINVPYAVEENGKKHLAAGLIRNVDQLSISDIDAQVDDWKRRRLDDTNLTKFVVRKKNNFLNRLYLKLVHFVAYGFPSVVEKKAGGLSLTLWRRSTRVPPILAAGFGPTAMTVLLSDVRPQAGRVVMRVGFGFNHSLLDGTTARLYIDAFGSELSAEQPTIMHTHGAPPNGPTPA